MVELLEVRDFVDDVLSLRLGIVEFDRNNSLVLTMNSFLNSKQNKLAILKNFLRFLRAEASGAEGFGDQVGTCLGPYSFETTGVNHYSDL